jgi:hypothetical protein
VGDMRISYAKFLQLLRGNRVKRLIIYGDLRTAIVEVSTAQHCSEAQHSTAQCSTTQHSTATRTTGHLLMLQSGSVSSSACLWLAAAGSVTVMHTRHTQHASHSRPCEVLTVLALLCPPVYRLQVPHPWTANIAGAPGQYGQYLGKDGRPLGILVPNPAAPNDPR